MKNLNKIFVLVIAIFVMCLYQDAIAQSRKGYINAQSNKQAVEKYFRDNIMLLDPIEGAYSVEQITKGWNNYMTFPDNVDNYYEIIVKNGSQFICLGNPSTSFERIGDTNVYNCKFKLNSPDGDLWFSQRVVLQNGALLTISKTLPIPGNVVGAKCKLTMIYKGLPDNLYVCRISDSRDSKKTTRIGKTGRTYRLVRFWFCP